MSASRKPGLLNWLIKNPKKDSNKSSPTQNLLPDGFAKSSTGATHAESPRNFQNKATPEESLNQIPAGSTSFKTEDLVLPTPQNASGRTYIFQPKWIKDFPWLETSTSVVYCKICRQAKQKNLFLESMQLQDRFISQGYCNWKHGKESFSTHQGSAQHLHAVAKILALNSKSIVIVNSEKKEKDQHVARIALKAIISSLIYLARQGLAFVGHTSEKGNFTQLLELRAHDIPELNTWLTRHKDFTSPIIQNEILQLISHKILRQKIVEVQQRKIFSLIVDETTDASGKEQVTICVRTVDNNLDVHEDFLGLYETVSTKAEDLTKIIVDSLARFDLNINNIRGQCYDGAANMAGIYSGVGARIQELEKRALYIHCSAHSLNLAVQDIIKSQEILRNSLLIVHEVGVLIRGSAKRQGLFDEILKTFDECDGNPTRPQPLCPTRWTVRGKNVSSILKHYFSVLKFLYALWESNDSCATKALGLFKQFSKGETYFGLLVLQFLLTPTEMLSTICQNKHSTVTGISKAVMEVTDTFLRNRNQSAFTEIWAKTQDMCENLELEPPELGRVRKAPKRFEKASPKVFDTVDEKYQDCFYKAIDSAVEEIKRRFTQASITTFQEYEDFLLNSKSMSGEVREKTLQKICSTYELDPEQLNLQLQMIHNNSNMECRSLRSFVDSFKTLLKEVRDLFPEVHSFLKILLVIPISSATAERSFSILRRIKDFLRTTMAQDRLNYCCIIQCYESLAKQLDVTDVMKEFVNKDYRRRVFGKF